MHRQPAARWDHIHASSSFPAELYPQNSFAGALGKRVASGIIIPLEADVAFPGFDADSQ